MLGLTDHILLSYSEHCVNTAQSYQQALPRLLGKWGLVLNRWRGWPSLDRFVQILQAKQHVGEKGAHETKEAEARLWQGGDSIESLWA